MVWLRKEHAGNAPGYSWPHDGAVVDVDPVLAAELLERPGDEFTEAQPPPEPEPEPESTSDGGDGEVSEAPTSKRRARKTTTEVSE